jgi:hypothetical protein
MVTYSGWIDIVFDIEEENISAKLKQVKRFMQEKNLMQRNAEIKTINGGYFLQVIGLTNHYSDEIKDTLELFTLVAQTAMESYGLLYIRDDDNDAKYNEFEVWRVARGQVTKFKDTLLSPCNEVIE